jgi:LPS-assembly protein
VRDAGSLGTQIIEPIVQVIAAPQSGNSRHDELPNEDSLGYEFSDSTLFTLNRFGGYDRYDGGLRANVALHGNWTFLGHQQLDAIIGASLDQHLTTDEYAQYYGLTGFNPGSHLSDILGRVTFAPNKWVDFTARARVDHSTGDLHYGEIVTGFGPPQLRVGLNYFYGSVNPFDQYLDAVFAPDLPYKNAITANYLQPRQELGGAVTAHYGRYTAVVGARTDTATGQLSNLTFDAKYEDECTIFDIHFLRRYTSINGDHGNTALLFTITFKTVGPIGFTG